MGPALNVFVHDAYVAGEGILSPAILDLIDLQDMRGGGDVAHVELMRFLAEAAWYPGRSLSQHFALYREASYALGLAAQMGFALMPAIQLWRRRAP